MNNWLSLVTGSTSGIGRALCVQLLERGDELVLVNRGDSRTREQIDALKRQFPHARIRHVVGDFADIGSIRDAARVIGEADGAIHSAFLLAGVLSGRGQLSNDGLELHFAVNCVAPYLLVQLLRPQLSAGRARVIVAGSSARSMARRLDPAAMFMSKGAGGMNAYARSKQAVTAAFEALAPEFAADSIGLRVVDVAPTKTSMSQSPALPLLFRLLRFAFVSPRRSAARLVDAANGAAETKPMRNLPDAATQTALLNLLDTAVAGVEGWSPADSRTSLGAHEPETLSG